MISRQLVFLTLPDIYERQVVEAVPLEQDVIVGFPFGNFGVALRRNLPRQITKAAMADRALYEAHSEASCCLRFSPSCSRSSGPPPTRRPRSALPTSHLYLRCHPSTLVAAALSILVQVFGRSWEPVKTRWLHLMIGGSLVHGLALATAHKALVSRGNFDRAGACLPSDPHRGACRRAAR